MSASPDQGHIGILRPLGAVLINMRINDEDEVDSTVKIASILGTHECRIIQCIIQKISPVSKLV